MSTKMNDLTQSEIQEKVSDPDLWEGSSQFLGINGNKVLWYDSDNDAYCINTFEILEDGSVEFSPMPVESFE